VINDVIFIKALYLKNVSFNSLPILSMESKAWLVDMFVGMKDVVLGECGLFSVMLAPVFEVEGDAWGERGLTLATLANIAPSDEKKMFHHK